MTPLRCLQAMAAMLVSGCAPGVSGIVQDAASGQPIARASVELSRTGWGYREGQLVWDAEKIARTTTGGDGRFSFDQSGGGGLRVAAAGHAKLITSLCARSPMIVRIGGPYPAMRADRRLVFGRNGSPERVDTDPTDASTAENLGLRMSGDALDDGSGLRVEAAGGVRLVRGTGAIPPPPPLPYARVLDLDLDADCGWLFVSDGASPVAVIQIGPLGWEEGPGEPRRWVMLYTPLPSGRVPSTEPR